MEVSSKWQIYSIHCSRAMKLMALETRKNRNMDSRRLANHPRISASFAPVGVRRQALGDVIGRLETEGLYERSLVIVVADHGASFRAGENSSTSEYQQPS